VKETSDMRISQRLTTAALAAACILGGAAPAAVAGSHAVSYSGKTRAGDPISFTLKGSKITNVKAYVPTLCLPTNGTPLSGTDAFDPPGTFQLGRPGKASAKRHNSMGMTSDVTKNFTLSTSRGPGRTISGKLHSDFSFLQVLYTYPISARPYVCTGDSTFRATPKR
jgi:hypothetical protein